MGKDKVTLLGVRGSVPVSGAAYERYGGATTCIMLELNGQRLIIDAGSGLVRLSGEALQEEMLPLILTHAHVDHLIGLPMCPYLLRKGGRMDIYAVTRDGLDAFGQVSRLFSPPLWPVVPDVLPTEMRWLELPQRLCLGPLTVDRMEGVHPGGVSLLRVQSGKKTVAILTDCTLTQELLPKLTDFARDCGLLLCDGQYSEAEWPVCSDFGHSTWIMASHFAASCGAKALRIIHHDTQHTDDILDAATREVKAIFPAGSFAREGEEVEL